MIKSELEVISTTNGTREFDLITPYGLFHLEICNKKYSAFFEHEYTEYFNGELPQLYIESD